MFLHSKRATHQWPLTLTACTEMNVMRGEVITYSKSWLAVNTYSGCPIGCQYCVLSLSGRVPRTPRRICTEATAVDHLLESKFFIPNTTPICLNITTEPFHEAVRESTLALVEELDANDLANCVGIITKVHPGQEFLRRIRQPNSVRLAFVVSYSGLPYDIEPTSNQDRVTLMSDLTQLGFPVIHYWRPLIPGVNTKPEHLRHIFSEIREISRCSVATGVKSLDGLKKRLQPPLKEVPLPSVPGSPSSLGIGTTRVLRGLARVHKEDHPVFFHTSCALAFLSGSTDYNAHYLSEARICECCPNACRQRHAAGDVRVKRTR